MSTLREAIDPDALEAIADEIDCHLHSARVDSLRIIARRERAAKDADIEKVKALEAENESLLSTINTMFSSRRLIGSELWIEGELKAYAALRAACMISLFEPLEREIEKLKDIR